MGIEMNCAVDIAMLDLEKKGFEIIDIRKEGYIMSGKFIDRNALVTLHATPKTNLLYRANIFLTSTLLGIVLKANSLRL